MINFIKNLLPKTFSGLGSIIGILATILLGIDTLLTGIAIILHKLFATDIGIKLIQIEESTNSIIMMYNKVSKQIAENKTAQTKEYDKLAAAAKNEPNVVQLGKKKDDDTKS